MNVKPATMIYINPNKIADKSEIIARARKYLEQNNQLDLAEFIRSTMRHPKASTHFVSEVAAELVKNYKYKMEIKEGRHVIFVQQKNWPADRRRSLHLGFRLPDFRLSTLKKEAKNI